MGVARERGVTKFVIVERTGAEGAKEARDVDTPFGSLAKHDHLLDATIVRRDDEYDDDDDLEPSPTLAITMTMPPTQPTDSTLPSTQQAQQGTNTVIQFSPPAKESNSGGKGDISSTTHHLLIAAGSIGATIILVMAILAFYTMRKRNLTFREALNHGKAKVTRRGSPPTPPKAETWDSKAPYEANYGSMRRSSVTPPKRAMSISRSGSNSSQRPLMALQRSESFRSNGPETAEPVQQSSFLLDSPPPPRNPAHRRQPSDTPSSNVLPLQTQSRHSESTHNTRSLSEAADLRFSEPPVTSTPPPLPPPPTFKQFLNNRPSVSQRAGPNAMISRFSWTNSNAPQTPHDASRDTATQIVGRDSFMTQRSSVPRFRTIDSWVDQQANRIEQQKLREQYRLTQSSDGSAAEDAHPAIPEVPEIPESVARAASAAAPVNPATADTARPLSPLPPPGLAGRNIAKHERHDTHTTVETAPIFRAHPGTEVRFSTRSAVPSEILDIGRTHTVLS